MQYVALIDLLGVIAVFILIIAILLPSIGFIYLFKRLDLLVPTSDELAEDFVLSLTDTKTGNKVFKKFILPFIGSNAVFEKELAGAFMADNPLIDVLEIISPTAAEKLKQKPQLIMSLPKVVTMLVGEKWGEVIHQIVGGQFQLMSLLSKGDITKEQAYKIQKEMIEGSTQQNLTPQQQKQMADMVQQFQAQNVQTAQPQSQPTPETTQQSEPLNSSAP